MLDLEPENQSAVLCLVWLLITTDDDDLRDVDRAERLRVAQLQRDGGRSDAVRRLVRDFALRTGRADAVADTLTQWMAAPGPHDRAALEHLRNNVRAGAPKGR